MSPHPRYFPTMRALGEEAERQLQRARDLSPRGGALAVGGAHMDPFFRGNAIEELLRAFRRGVPLADAVTQAKAASHEAVRKWNRSRGDDYQVHRWEGTADHVTDDAARRLAAVAKGQQSNLFERIVQLRVDSKQP